MSPLDQQSNFIEVFRTGKLWEIELVEKELTQRNIPHYQQEVTSSGLQLAKPVAPVMGPGVWWAMLIPPEFEKEVRDLLQELPIEVESEPGVWHYNDGKKSQGFRMYAFGIFIAAVATLIFMFIGFIREAMRY